MVVLVEGVGGFLGVKANQDTVLILHTIHPEKEKQKKT